MPEIISEVSTMHLVRQTTQSFFRGVLDRVQGFTPDGREIFLHLPCVW